LSGDEEKAHFVGTVSNIRTPFDVNGHHAARPLLRLTGGHSDPI
jgi:hypothetical protein